LAQGLLNTPCGVTIDPAMKHDVETIGSGDTPRSSTATSRSLLDRIRADDAVAWDRLVDLYAPLLFQWCRRWDLPQQEMPDIFQEVFQAVATHIAEFRKETDSDTFRGWLRTIARNKVNDHFRRQGREPAGIGGTEAQIRFARLPAIASEDESDSDVEKSDQLLFSRALELIRTEFESRTWQAFWLTTIEARDTQYVAAELKMTPGAVRVAKSRVLRRLREELGD
jgi:RNA polymerase sigma-70 factor, ECF subfamily